MDAQTYKQAMRHCAGAVALVTVGREAGRRTGLTVTAVCSLSDDPPSLIVCVNRNASAHPRIREEGCFVVNFLGEEHAPLALTFAGRKGVNGDARFALGDWAVRATGTPVLADAIVAFDCDLREEFETKTHSVFVGEVRAVHLRDAHLGDGHVPAEARPLVYVRGGFHGLCAIA
ncbi:flavin reductase family protein [Phreatobacter stygius]|uniref:Flavin reductase family protein n=1 Tax=Phreatobacter stygius TaxID=1940610 RepID=A0A4D7B5B6_9HYPH|nr:flavin reductase family protein [Phreatobacter stygius]QCI65290.1 flavin reductase family protein [Phreatobacter stygius]